MNPGGGRDNGLGANDLALYEVLQKLRNSNDADASSAFQELTALLEHIMPFGRIFRNFVGPVLEYAQLDFTGVAYLNLLKWRTKKSSGIRRLYDLSWQHHTGEQFSLVDPSVVIAIGSSAGKALSRLAPKNVHLETIPRVIGSNIGAEGRLALERIKKWFARNQFPTG
jgi:hypothetical protein